MSRTFPIVFATLAAFAFLQGASLRAQPAEKPPAENQTVPATKRPSPEKKNDSPQKSTDARKPGAKKPGDDRPGEKKPQPNRPEAGKSDEKKPGREALAKAFAEEHHPELASLLKTLEKMSPQAYEAAVRDVSRAADRLNALKERDSERYDRELDVWKARSRVHVVSAEYRVSPGSDLEKKLRNLMQDELEAKRKLLTFEHEKAEKRLGQLDRELRELDEKGAAMIDRQIERLPKVPASTTKKKPNS